MFKAQLIDNEDYYRLQSKMLWLTFLPIGAMLLVVVFYEPTKVYLTLLILIFLIRYLIFNKIKKAIKEKKGEKQIEVDDDEIRIIAKNGQIEETITLNHFNKYIVKYKLVIPDEITNAYLFRPTKKFLILEREGQKREWDFEVGSDYMINQLNKIIENWKGRGMVVEQLA